VVDLEPEGRATSLASIVLIGAALAVAVEHRTAHGCGDVTRAASRWSGMRPNVLKWPRRSDIPRDVRPKML